MSHSVISFTNISRH